MTSNSKLKCSPSFSRSTCSLSLSNVPQLAHYYVVDVSPIYSPTIFYFPLLPFHVVIIWAILVLYSQLFLAPSILLVSVPLDVNSTLVVSITSLNCVRRHT